MISVPDVGDPCHHILLHVLQIGLTHESNGHMLHAFSTGWNNASGKITEFATILNFFFQGFLWAEIQLLSSYRN